LGGARASCQLTAGGPLKGVKVLEFAGIGPGPFAGMMLSDMGADVLRIERPGASDPTSDRLDVRGRRTLALDLKQPRAVALCLDLCTAAEIVFEGNRPGVMERLGLGPEAMHARNPKLVYGRMTGWGQYGPNAQAAGHDINYLALTGALHAIGTRERPVPPLNLAADYGGGAMFLIAGLLAGLIHARASGQGQVVDAAMTDGASYLMTMFYGMLAGDKWVDVRAANKLDGGAHFYDTYQCADGRWIALGSIEPQFYALLLEKIGGGGKLPQPQMEQAAWSEAKRAMREIFGTKSRDHWCELLENTDACFAPVLSLHEAPRHPHNVARKTFVDLAGVTAPAPAPRFSATPSQIQSPPRPIGARWRETLRGWGIADADIDKLATDGVIRQRAEQFGAFEVTQ
jgi:alpha-methylacyl-CoA racemase